MSVNTFFGYEFISIKIDFNNKKLFLVPETQVFVITNDKNLVNKSCICKINATNFNGLKLNILNWIKTDKKSTGLQKPASPTHLNINNNNNLILFKCKQLNVFIDRIVCFLVTN